ncbi:MAG: efflux RND transporter periplasmic adaptor subunit [Gemmatimonadetes bacterium]|nr:efflux RND transporter periplasmic adaptor subunit [Gemmatimonadota bacterium]
MIDWARPVTLLVLSGLLLPGCRPPEADAEGPDSAAAAPERPSRTLALPVVGRPVHRGDLVLTVATTGQVRSDAIATLRAETAGRVDDVLVRPGSKVSRGQVLVRLDSMPFVLSLREAQTVIDQADLQYRDLLITDSIVTGEAPTEQKRHTAAARSGLAAAMIRYDQRVLERRQATIVAPFDGTVDRVEVTAGERVSSGEDLLTLVDGAHLWIEASVLEHDLPLIREGGRAVVTTAAHPDQPIIGRITTLLPLVDSTTRAGRAVVRVRGTGGLRPGMYADVELETTRLADRLLVPSAAVIERDGRPLVFVVRDGRAQWVYLQLGRSNGIDTEVLPDDATGEFPLVEGDTVLIEGHLTLTHDAPVRLVATREN